ncbi:hypothetical protein K437DRAFT_260047 [Tilletiaria anomala UBC 951]|uniref:Class E vacuolar protein-sorting machinery protein HSE1 n=1 Tax=Tilletiaria anomala (strain ATCC 24038 / CBS 436.72 / UBC 951) TaxID=1037660 RepID=A0A066V5D3_TILAU|nr:uncharacterized protein K437DRAFT_260047 [Tilletiaria anomala UBC 951]KDN36691.1 hypothetical protein K437DRAFT_260047 [Tilletiaria anomala UBC 951]
MFKAANPYDELVAKATDEHLTSENWELNLDVCDKVSGQGETAARDCIAAIAKRLLHRSANVQLYALTLADSLSKNVPGHIIYPELSSRAFCQALARLIADERNTHATVRKKAAANVQQWAADMGKPAKGGSGNGSSGAVDDDGNSVGAIMKETYDQLKHQHPSFFDDPAGNGSGADGSVPPTEPSSAQLRREDEELRRVLELSLQDQGGRHAVLDSGAGAEGSSGGSSGGGGAFAGASSSAMTAATGTRVADHGVSGESSYPVANNTTSSSETPKKGQQPQANGGSSTGGATGAPGALAASRVRALYDFQPTEHGELAFAKGDFIRVLDSVYEHWWRGEVRGEVGIFPVNYVEILPDPTPEDIQRDAELEARIFSSASSIDLLIAKLSSLDPRKSNLSDDEELQDLYQQALSIRPKIIRLIDRYSAKVAELKGLNEKFTKARGTFEGLMEESLQRWEPNKAGSSNRDYLGHRMQPQPQLQQHMSDYTGSAGAHGDLMAQQQQQPHQQQDYSQAWAAYYAQQGYQPGQYPPHGQGQPPAAVPATPGQVPAAGAVSVPQPPPGLDPRDPAYAQWYYAHFGHPNQQQPHQTQRYEGGYGTVQASVSAVPDSAAPPSSAAMPTGAGSSGSTSGAPVPAGGPASSVGGEAVPQDDEKRRLFERARAEADAYQSAHRAYLSGQQQHGASGAGSSGSNGHAMGIHPQQTPGASAP